MRRERRHSVPCPFPAGTPAKIAMLRQRVEQRQLLFDPRDNLAIKPDPKSCDVDDPLLAQMIADAPIELRLATLAQAPLGWQSSGLADRKTATRKPSPAA